MKIFSNIMLALVIAFSAMSVAHAEEETPSSLRAEAAKLYTQADELTEKALKLEAEQASEVKSRGNEVKLRGYGAHQCVMDCIPHGGRYSCRRACGAY